MELYMLGDTLTSTGGVFLRKNGICWSLRDRSAVPAMRADDDVVPSPRDTALTLRTPTTPSLDTAMLVIADYYGGSQIDIKTLATLVHMTGSMISALGNEKDVLLKRNAPHRGVQCEFVIFRTILPRFLALYTLHRDRSPHHGSPALLMMLCGR